MTTPSQSVLQPAPDEAAKVRGSELRSIDGLGANAPMPLERKILILAGMACILGVCAGLMTMALCPLLNAPGLFLPAAVFALLYAWIGNSIACVLKANPHDSSPNAVDVGRAGNGATPAAQPASNP